MGREAHVESPSMTVVEEVAAATGRDSTDLPALQNHVDCDALDTVLDVARSSPTGAVRVSLSYAGSHVVVDSDGVDVSGHRTGTDADSPAVRRDWRDADTPLLTIVESVATATGRDLTELPALQNRIDCDALGGLLNSARSSPPGAVSVSLSYADSHVVVDSDGDVGVWL